MWYYVLIIGSDFFEEYLIPRETFFTPCGYREKEDKRAEER